MNTPRIGPRGEVRISDRVDSLFRSSMEEMRLWRPFVGGNGRMSRM